MNFSFFNKKLQSYKKTKQQNNNDKINQYTEYEKKLSQSSPIDLYVHAFRDPHYFWDSMNDEEQERFDGGFEALMAVLKNLNADIGSEPPLYF